MSYTSVTVSQNPALSEHTTQMNVLEIVTVHLRNYFTPNYLWVDIHAPFRKYLKLFLIILFSRVVL